MYKFKFILKFVLLIYLKINVGVLDCNDKKRYKDMLIIICLCSCKIENMVVIGIIL